MRYMLLVLALGGCATGTGATANQEQLAWNQLDAEGRRLDAQEATLAADCQPVYAQVKALQTPTTREEADLQAGQLAVLDPKLKACQAQLDMATAAREHHDRLVADLRAGHRERLDAEYEAGLRRQRIAAEAVKGVGQAMRAAPSTTTQTHCTPDYAGGMNCVSR